MKIEGEAIVLACRKFQESGLIYTLFSREYGIVKGYVRSTKSYRDCPPGAITQFIHTSRVASQLGTLKLEVTANITNLLGFHQVKLLLIQSVLHLLASTLIEHDPHEELYQAVAQFLINLGHVDNDLVCLQESCILDQLILRELGYGLDLHTCIATKSTENLAYISPKSGSAVCHAAGAIYERVMFKMPQLFKDPLHFDIDDIVNAMRINDHFIKLRIFEPLGKPMPDFKNQIIKLIEKRNIA